MVKFAEVQANAVVQLGRFNGERRGDSYGTGIVVSKATRKVGKNVYHVIMVQTGARRRIQVQLHNIREILA